MCCSRQPQRRCRAWSYHAVFRLAAAHLLHEDKARRVKSLQPGTRNFSIQAFLLQLCRIPWNIYDWIMLDFAVDLDNSGYGKRSICILAYVFAVDFGNRVIPGFGPYCCLRQVACARASGPSKYCVQNENIGRKIVTLEMSRVM